MTKSLELKGFAELIQALRETPDLAKPILQKSMNRSLLVITAIVQQYPPQPRRDRSQHFNTYVRGVGRYPRSSFAGGELKKRGSKAAGPRGGKIDRTSERLGTKWTQKVEITKEGATGYAGNTASYADLVQGEHQTAFHQATGWPTLEEAVNLAEADVNAIFEEGRDELVKQWNRG